MSDPSRLTATQAVAAIRAGTLSTVALTEACLARIAERDPAIHAFAHLDAASAAEAARDPVQGILHGVPVGVKDVLDVAGMPTGQGSPIWAGWRPRADASCPRSALDCNETALRAGADNGAKGAACRYALGRRRMGGGVPDCGWRRGLGPPPAAVRY